MAVSRKGGMGVRRLKVGDRRSEVRTEVVGCGQGRGGG